MNTTDLLLMDEERAILGLGHAVPGPVVEHEVPEAVAWGRMRPTPIASQDLEPPSTPFSWEAPLSAGNVCRETLALDWVGSILRITATDEVPIRGKALGSGILCRNTQAHVVEVDGEGRAVVQRPDGLVLVVSREGGSFRHQEWTLHSEAVPPLAEPHLDLKPFVAHVEDPWLRAEMEKRDRDSWSRVVALGIFRRFYLVTLGRESTRRAVADILSGSVPPHPTDRWVESLAPDQVETITSNVVSSAILLKQDLQELSDDYRPADEDWIARWVEACHERDDLEGVRWLLSRSQDIAEALEELDRFARRVTASFAPCLKRTDHRLLLALSNDQEAWWVDPVRDPRDHDFLT